jgi:transcriptional regulator with XRE-family HTH domain
MAVTAPPNEFRRIVEAGIPPDQLARLTGKSERTAQRWLAGETEPRGETRLLLAEISEVINEFKRTFPGGDVSDWIDHRDPDLDFRRPIDLIREGDTRQVLGLLLAIGEGVYL